MNIEACVGLFVCCSKITAKQHCSCSLIYEYYVWFKKNYTSDL